MKYISVTAPGTEMSEAIFNYFDSYLISFGEIVTGGHSWGGEKLQNNLGKILEEKEEYFKNTDTQLYIDSGGFQIIMGYIGEGRIAEFIKYYHMALEKYYKSIDRIFTLDIFNHEFDETKIRKLNRYSLNESIKLIKKYPEIKDKQLLVLQTSNFTSFKIWRKMMLVDKLYEHFKLWSIGGLVGLKKRTNAKFSHAVPATLWLLTYQKHFNFEIEQVHWLGQSSRLSFLAMGLFERIYNLNMTSDSSALVRFAPLDQKLPLIHGHSKDKDFDLAIEVDDVNIMFDNHSFDNSDQGYYNHKQDLDTFNCKNIPYIDRINSKKDWSKKHREYLPSKEKEYYPIEFKTRKEFANKHLKDFERLDNSDLTELQAQGVYFEIQFANMICDKIMDIGIENFVNKEQVIELHPILKRGRTANELMNNINFFNRFKSIVDSGSVDEADEIMVEVVKNYQK